MHFDLTSFIQTVGYLGVFSIIFLESGLMIGFFFPGDSVLFTAGFLASQGYLNISFLIKLTANPAAYLTAVFVGSFCPVVAVDGTS